jgi:hypothetical protein
VGGGKTRVLEEIRRCLLRRGIFALAITFNCNSTPDAEKSWTSIRVRVRYAISVVMRIFASYYAVEFNEIADMCDELIERFKIYSPSNIITEAINLVITDARKRSTVNQFVLLIDECKAIEEILTSEVDKVDLHGNIRKILLNKGTCLMNIDTALVMSSLSIKSFGFTDSNRPIFIIELVLNTCIRNGI